MPVRSVVDGAALARVVAVYRDLLAGHRDALDRLNVYPVPDGDTGTNMALTLASVVGELPPDPAALGAGALGAVCDAVAHGSLMGARGNSGVILSQILRGFTEVWRGLPEIGPEALTAGLLRGADAAYGVVQHPVEGTILTVIRTVADAVATAAGDPTAEPALGLEQLLTVAAAAADRAVADTPTQLEVLARAGVVDAGGSGLALLFAAFCHVAAGAELPVAPAADGGGSRGEPGDGHGPPAGERGFARYEVMFLLDADATAVDAMRAAWDDLGESIVVVGGDGLWNCHVHTDDIGGAIEAGVAAGRPFRIAVADLAEQVAPHDDGHLGAPGATGGAPVAGGLGVAVVAVGAGPGVEAGLRDLGAHHVVSGGQSMNPSTAEILAAVEATGAAGVLVLPNNANVIAVARQVVPLAGRPVVVVATRSVVEGLAALVHFDPGASLADNAETMTDAALRVQTGEVARAVRAGYDRCGPIDVGDWLAIARDGIAAKGSDALDAAAALVDHLLGVVGPNAELVTVLVGAEADPSRDTELRARLEATHPGLAFEVVDGGQPLYAYFIGAE